MSEDIQSLIDRWERARQKYDEYLDSAYQMISADGKKLLSEDRAKLQARRAMREDGLDDPEVLKMRIWARIGVRVITDGGS
ncbi:MAG TPA: hypothetical protein VFK94_06355 [Patescibacteria group bacterium]|nr:hypothetical protein [Patescibacteria group bacterium]